MAKGFTAHQTTIFTIFTCVRCKISIILCETGNLLGKRHASKCLLALLNNFTSLWEFVNKDPFLTSLLLHYIVIWEMVCVTTWALLPATRRYFFIIHSMGAPLKTIKTFPLCPLESMPCHLLSHPSYFGFSITEVAMKWGYFHLYLFSFLLWTTLTFSWLKYLLW